MHGGNATHTLHNLLTLRGTLVRDPHVWAHYLTEAIELFAGESDVVFASHHWPTWGTENIIEFLSVQRDLYAYLHDQTMRLLNQGYTGPEIAEMIELPPPGSRPGTRTAATAGSATTSRPSVTAMTLAHVHLATRHLTGEKRGRRLARHHRGRLFTCGFRGSRRNTRGPAPSAATPGGCQDGRRGGASGRSR